MAVGLGPEPGLVTVVGMPLGVDTPGRPPRMPPAPGKLPNEPPPAPGIGPSSEPDEPGRAGTLVSTVGPWALAWPVKMLNANTDNHGQSILIPVSACFCRGRGVAVPVFHMNPARKFMC